MKRVYTLGLGIILTTCACTRGSGRTIVLPGAGSAPASSPDPPVPGALWIERFDEPQLTWQAPMGNTQEQISKVYSVQREDGLHFLHARHDCRPEMHCPPFLHFGKKLDPNPPSLERIGALRWKWRVLEHPKNPEHPWQDVAASVYVIIKVPGAISAGKGFRFGWLARPGPKGTSRRGIARIALREEPATREWRAESVDVCARFREIFGPCEGQKLHYIGVATEADDTRSVAIADYTDFELIASGP